MPRPAAKPASQKLPQRGSAPLWLSAEFALGDGDVDAARSITGVAYSGGLIPSLNCVLDLASTQVDPNMPLLFQHKQDVAIGVIDSANDGQQIAVSGSLFADIDDTARQVAAKSKRGLRYQMSVGIYGGGVDAIAAGKRISINGREFTGPITVLRRGHVRECSITSLGADPQTSASFFSAAGDAPGALSPEQSMDLEALTARVAELEADKTALAARADAAENALAAHTKEVRLSAVRDLFKKTGREFSEASAAPYVTLSADAFTAVAADMTAIAKQLPAHLFSERAIGSIAGESSPLLADARARGWVKA